MKCLSRMTGNCHVRFLGGKAVVTPLTQPITSSGGKHGMGIGLSVCAAIIKAHGGEIKAESTPGEGTTIRFWLETEEVDTEETEDEQ